MVDATTGFRDGRLDGTRSNPHIGQHRHGHRMETSESGGIRIDLDDGLVGGDPGVIGERCAEHHQQVCFIHEPACDRSP